MALDEEQRKSLDALDNFTEQTFVSGQYSSIVLRLLRQWRDEGRPVGIDSISDWAMQRELDEWAAGARAG